MNKENFYCHLLLEKPSHSLSIFIPIKDCVCQSFPSGCQYSPAAPHSVCY